MIDEEDRAYYKVLGAHITQLRKAHGMTQAELAKEIGVAQQTMFSYETGIRSVTVPMLAKLSKLFAVPVADLMGMTKVPRRPRLSPKVIRSAKRIQQLSKTEQRLVIKLIDTMAGSR